MVRFRSEKSWQIVPLWEGLRSMVGLDVYYHTAYRGRLFEAEKPGGMANPINAVFWLAYHANAPRFYVLVGVRPLLHLLVVRSASAEHLAAGIEYIQGELEHVVTE